jgi:RNA polymerase sigma factor (sigma-70 family)
MKNVLKSYNRYEEFNEIVSLYKNIDLISHEEEKELFKEYLKTKSKAAREKIILSCIPYVVKEVSGRRSGFQNLDFVDMFHAGVSGIVEAFNNFSFDFSNRFFTYAYFYINKEIKGYIEKNFFHSSALTTADKKKVFWFLLKDSGKDYRKCDQFELKTIVDELGVAVEDFNFVMNAFYGNNSVSFNESFDEDVNLNEEFLIESVSSDVEDEFFLSVYDDIEEEDMINYLKEEIKKSCAMLKDNEREIINYRFLNPESKTLKEIAEIMGLSMQRVSVIEKNAKANLFKIMNDNGFGVEYFS